MRAHTYTHAHTFRPHTIPTYMLQHTALGHYTQQHGHTHSVHAYARYTLDPTYARPRQAHTLSLTHKPHTPYTRAHMGSPAPCTARRHVERTSIGARLLGVSLFRALLPRVNCWVGVPRGWRVHSVSRASHMHAHLHSGWGNALLPSVAFVCIVGRGKTWGNLMSF